MSALLEVANISKNFGRLAAVHDVSMSVQSGDIRAIIGPNGAGKTTMMDIVTGKTRPDEGEVFFDGLVDLTKHDEAEIARRRDARGTRRKREVRRSPRAPPSSRLLQETQEAHPLPNCLEA